MKLLHITNWMGYGGAEKLLVDTLPKYKEQGIDTELLLLNDYKTPFYKALRDIKIHSTYNSISFYNPLHIFKIRRIIKKFDIIHVHLFPSLYWVSLASLFMKNKPIIIATEHNTNNRRRGNKIFQIIDRFIYNRFNTIIAISTSVQKLLQKHLGQQYYIPVIANGILVNTFENATGYLKSDFGIEEKQKVIIQVSGFSPQKDQITLLKAITLLPNNVSLILVGDGPLLNNAKDIAKQLGIDKRVLFLGQREDIPQLIKMSDIYVLSSHFEGFCLAILEGMASRKPCIASNINGLKGTIGKAGLLFEKSNHIELSEKLQLLLNDEKLSKKVSEQCLKRSKKFDISIMVENHIKLYQTLLS